jgi:hypothetical protein
MGLFINSAGRVFASIEYLISGNKIYLVASLDFTNLKVFNTYNIPVCSHGFGQYSRTVFETEDSYYTGINCMDLSYLYDISIN